MTPHHPLFFLYLFSLCLATTCRAADTFFSIWPLFNTDGMNEDGSNNQAITDALNADLNHDATKLFISRSNSLSSTWYWYAALTPDLVTKYKSFPGVRLVVQPDNDSSAFSATRTRARRSPVRRSSLTTDAAALDQLQVLSLPPGKSIKDSVGYVYDSSAGEGINIYVIDSGITPGSPEFSSRTVSWLFAGPFAAHDMSDSNVGEPGAEPAAQGHGTCMASIAMGNKDGVARKASLTVVRSDVWSSALNAANSAEIWIDALAQVYDDVVKNKGQGKAVVSMSIGVTANINQDYTGAFTGAMISLLMALDKEDIPAVAAVSNRGTEIDAYPALLAKPLPEADGGKAPVPDLIVVSGALVDGDFDSDIRDPVIKIYGISDDQTGGGIANPGLECASLDGKGYHAGGDGVSHATAGVAGMVAYFMGQGNSGAASRQALYDNAVVRVKNGPPMPWNKVDGTGGK